MTTNYSLLAKCFTFWLVAAFITAISGPWADNIGFSLLEEHEQATSTDEMQRLRSVFFDAGRHYFPHLDAPWLADTMLMFLLGLLVICLALSKQINRDHFVATFFQVHGVVILLRSAAIFSTVDVISPVVVERILNGESLSQLRQRGTIGWLANNNCFDMVFSGHTATGVTFTLLGLHSTAPLVLRAFVVMAGLMNCCIQVMVGDHYSRDVVIGVYVTVMVFYLVLPRVHLHKLKDK